MTDDGGAAPGTPASLVGAVLEEEERREAAATGREKVVLPDDLLPGVGGEGLPLRQALRESLQDARRLESRRRARQLGSRPTLTSGRAMGEIVLGSCFAAMPVVPG